MSNRWNFLVRSAGKGGQILGFDPGVRNIFSRAELHWKDIEKASEMQSENKKPADKKPAGSIL
jgi:hypothetical protein